MRTRAVVAGALRAWQRWQRPLAIAVLVLAVALGTASIARRWDDVSSTVVEIGPWPVLLCVGLSVLGVMATAEAWRSLLPHAGGRLPRLSAHRVFYLTQSGKYVPGSVWPLVAQASAASRYGMPARAMPLTSLLFLAGAVATGLVLSGALLRTDLLGLSHWWLAVAGALALAVISPWGLTAVRSRVPGTLARLLPHVERGPALVALLWLVTSWFCYGISTWVLLQPLEGARTSLLTCVGVYALAWCIGFLVVIAPAGAGPRDAAFVVLLGLTVTPATALSVAVLTRIAITVADLTLAAASVGELRIRHPAAGAGGQPTSR